MSGDLSTAALVAQQVGRSGGSSTVADFLSRHGIRRTKFYSEVKAGRLRIVRCGGRTLVLDEDAEAWRRALPAVQVRTRTPETAGQE